LLVSLSLTALLAPGCADSSVPSDLSIRSLVSDLVYQGQTYRFTGVRLGLERMSPKGLTYTGTDVSPGDAASPTDAAPTDSGYQVYTIAGVDPNQAIAVRFIAQSLSGKDGPFFEWIRYERKE
jgi:hypothetical protein